ncbi:hypothetical protein C8R47DRAFT_50035 [Mycena vitilis]|nr:hypothetical protein C8R47DRAFT_50035 [Mycena vitilis]
MYPMSRFYALFVFLFWRNLRFGFQTKMPITSPPTSNPSSIARHALFEGSALCRGNPDADVTSNMLQGTSSTTELVILADDPDSEKDANALLMSLTVPYSAGTVVAPHLCLIFLGIRDDGRIDNTRYLAMLKSRWKVDGCALKSAALFIESPPADPTRLDGIRALGQNGLDLLVVVGNDAGDEIKCLPHGTSWN